MATALVSRVTASTQTCTPPMLRGIDDTQPLSDLLEDEQDRYELDHELRDILSERLNPPIEGEKAQMLFEAEGARIRKNRPVGTARSDPKTLEGVPVFAADDIACYTLSPPLALNEPSHRFYVQHVVADQIASTCFSVLAREFLRRIDCL